MSDQYRDSEERYRRDADFHAAVTMLERLAMEHGFTPGELKQIAFKASLNIELRNWRPSMVPTEVLKNELRERALKVIP